MNQVTRFGPRSIPFRLDEDQIRLATWAGTERQAYAQAHGLEHIIGPVRDPLLNHINACMTEIIVASWAGHIWKPNIGRTNADDVGPMQVRSAFSHSGWMPIRERDRDKGHFPDPFVLVTGTPETGFMIRGWRRAADVAAGPLVNPGNRGPCWQVFQHELWDMRELLRRLHRGHRDGWQFI